MIFTLLKHELLLARKQSGAFGASLCFILALLVLVPLAIGPDLNLLQRIAPGILWLALLLAVLLTSERIFQQDLEDGTLDLLTMSELPFELTVLIKSLAHFLSVSLPLALLAPPLALMLNINIAALPMLWFSMILGGLALSLFASLGAALTAGLRRGGLLISLLILPLYIPVLVFGIAAATATPPQSPWPSLLLLCALVLVALVITPFACAAALRAYMK